ncbi:Cytochrome P450 4A24, partial [Dissostichus eleginoides]
DLAEVLSRWSIFSGEQKEHHVVYTHAAAALGATLFHATKEWLWMQLHTSHLPLLDDTLTQRNLCWKQTLDFVSQAEITHRSAGQKNGACPEATIVCQLNPVISWLECGLYCLQTAAWHDRRESDTHAMHCNTPPPPQTCLFLSVVTFSTDNMLR